MTQNHFVIPATVLEKFRSRGFPEGVTLTADHCITLISVEVLRSRQRGVTLKAPGPSGSTPI